MFDATSSNVRARSVRAAPLLVGKDAELAALQHQLSPVQMLDHGESLGKASGLVLHGISDKEPQVCHDRGSHQVSKQVLVILIRKHIY